MNPDFLRVGNVPTSWRKYPYRSTLGVSGWITDFASRLNQARSFSSSPSNFNSESDSTGTGSNNNNNVHVQLSKLFNPESWLTATQQTVAHRDGVALESLELSVELGDREDKKAFAIDGEFFFVFAFGFFWLDSRECVG